MQIEPTDSYCSIELKTPAEGGSPEPSTAVMFMFLSIALWNFGFFFCSVEGLVPSSLSDTILGAKSRIQNNL